MNSANCLALSKVGKLPSVKSIFFVEQTLYKPPFVCTITNSNPFEYQKG
jgi:hypothetical protein